VKEPYTTNVSGRVDSDPFGMMMEGRSWEVGSGYRYGFNGKEQDAETYGDGNIYDYGFRVYDPRLGKFLSIDPLTKSYPWYTPYQFAGNTPIWAIDVDGLEDQKTNNGSPSEPNTAASNTSTSYFDDPMSVILNQKPSAESSILMENFKTNNKLINYGGTGVTEKREGMITGHTYEVPKSGFDRYTAFAVGFALEGIYSFNKNINPFYILPNSIQSYSSGKDLITQNEMSSAEATLDLAGIIPIGKFGKIGGEIVTMNLTIGSKSDLSKHLGQIEKYGQDGVKELQNGRFRYYGNIIPASNAGEMQGARLVREWNPTSGNTRTWYETIDHSGTIRQFHPKYDNLNHYTFDIHGKYKGKW